MNRRALPLKFALVAVLAFASAIASAAPIKVNYDEAVTHMGRGVFVGTGSSMPPNLVTMMRKAAMKREGRTNVYYLSTFAPKTNFEAAVTDKWHPNLFFVSGSNREAAANAHTGQATLHRASLFELSQRLGRDHYAIDTVVVRVSPPDAEGMVSLGTNADLTLPAIKSALRRGGKIIAEVNPNVPHAKGNRIPYDSLTAVMESSDALGEHTHFPTTAIEQKIAKNVARLIPSRRRATLQIGIGNALNGLGDALTRKRLNLWSELGGEWLVPLMTAPEGQKPTLKKGKVSFLLGTNKLYDVLRKNQALEIEGSDVLNNPETIAAQKKMRAINTALQVDLTGNVNAEQIGTKVISSPGGQPDFMKGASMAKDGRAILALRSVHEKSNASTIVLGLEGPTTTPKEHVDHIVTEWGATKQLRGLTDGARAYQIILVAHPSHRASLAQTALGRGLINQKQHDKLVRSIAHAERRANEAQTAPPTETLH